MSELDKLILFLGVMLCGLIGFLHHTGIIYSIISTIKDNHWRKDSAFIYETRMLITRPLLREGNTQELPWPFRRSKDNKLYQVKKYVNIE